VNATTHPAGDEPGRIRFGNGHDAVAWKDHGTEPGDLPGVLGLRIGRPVIVVSGGADDLTGAELTRAADMLGPAVSGAAAACGAVVVDGGTSSGVMKIIGTARSQRPDTMPVLLGVAPAGRVTYQDEPDDDRAPLEQNHSHFVLADSSKWGGETGLLMALSAALAGEGRPVLVLAGGGSGAMDEVLEAVRRRWPVFVIGETGGLADSLLTLWAAQHEPRRHPASRLLLGRSTPRTPPPLSTIDDVNLREIIGTGDVRPVTDADPGQLARQLAWESQDEPILKAAWKEFATYDHLARRLRAAFTRFQAAILLLGVMATLLALIYSEVHNRILHWLVVAIPVLISVLIALASRHAVGQRWVMLRAAAEAVKAEIYRYRTRTGPYCGQPADEDRAARQRALAAHLDAVESRLMQTEVSGGQLTPYAGPLPPAMYGAGRDDDGLSLLGAERYLQIRVTDQLAYYHGRVHTLSRLRSLLQLLAISAGGAGAILAAAGFDIWVGLTGGMAAAALAYMGSLQIDNTIVTYNQSATKLAGLERQWHALSPGQRNPAAFSGLVTAAEDVLTSELVGWVQQMNDAMRELKERQASSAAQAEPKDTAHGETQSGPSDHVLS
jgi:hypothetical protein